MLCQSYFEVLKTVYYVANIFILNLGYSIHLLLTLLTSALQGLIVITSYKPVC